MSKSLKIVTWLLIIASIVFISILGLTVYIKTSHRMEYRQAEPVALAYIPREITYTREEVRKKIENLAGKQLYFYGEQDLYSRKHIYGETVFFIRLIIMQNNSSIEDYIFNFAHEYMHLKYMTASERFVNFEAFKLLYESDDECFRNVAIMYANQDMYGNIPETYSCWGQIYEYLKGEN